MSGRCGDAGQTGRSSIPRSVIHSITFRANPLMYDDDVLIGIIIALNSSSVAWTIRVTNVFTLAKLAAIASMIGCGIYQLSTGNTNQSLTRGFEGSTTDISTIALAFYSGLWSYSGWYT